MPLCWGASGSVRARQMPQSARWATEVHTFWPVSFQPPSTRSALVRSEARSEPDPGSEKSWHHTSSPRSDGGTNRSRCSSLPCSRIVGSAQPAITMSGPGDAGPGQLLVDDDLGDRVGAEAVRRGPVRRQVAGLDQRRAALVLRERRRSARPPPAPRAAPRRRGPRRSTSTLPAYAVDRTLGQPQRRRVGVADQRAQREGPAQVEVRVVLVGEADAAEHLDAGLGDLDRAVEAGHLGHVGGVRPLLVVTAEHTVRADRRDVPGRGGDGLGRSRASPRRGA